MELVLTLHLIEQKGAKSITSGNLMCLFTFWRLYPAWEETKERGKQNQEKKQRAASSAY